MPGGLAQTAGAPCQFGATFERAAAILVRRYVIGVHCGVRQWRMRHPAERSLVEIIETPVFTQQVRRLLTDEEYRLMQLALVLRPHGGPVIPGSGGLRKLRWSLAGGGKRGGARIIYYWIAARGRLYLLFIYSKRIQADLNGAQVSVLRRLVEEELR